METIDSFFSEPSIATTYCTPRLAGRGGMATVYEVFDIKRGCNVALKLLNIDQLQAEKMQRFRREFEFLSSLSHPNIVKAYNFIETPDGRAAFTTEFLYGDSLLSAAGTLRESPAACVQFLKKLALVLSFIHRNNIIYCDLSPANILIESKDWAKDQSFKLIDFGIAQPATGVGVQTLTNVGTGAFMSPEQIDGTSVDVHTDVYGFGALAYFLLTGTAPYSGSDENELRLSIKLGRVPLLRARAKNWSERTEKTIAICMQKLAKHRYDDIEDVVPRLVAPRAPHFASS